ncbi:MAG: MoxR family ATPase [Cyanobacteria bacterium P01_C01_bin.118]
MSTLIQVRPQRFVQTTALGQLIQRAMRYMRSGYSLHLEGPTGVGKTALAMKLADCRRRPVRLLMGHRDLMVPHQPDAWFSRACCEGWTLIYDEFNRSRPELNTMLLSALEERTLLFLGEHGTEYLPIHPEFRVIFTSNSEDYCGTYSPQSALLDRLVTIRLPEPTVLAQQQLLVELVGVSNESAALVIGLVQQFFRQVSPENMASLRPKLMIAQVCHREGIMISAENAEFRQVCRDILLARSSQSATDANEVLWELFNQLSRRLTMLEPAVEASRRSLEQMGY